MTKLEQLEALIAALPEDTQRVWAKNKLQLCLLAMDLVSIHIYLVGILDMFEYYYASDRCSEDAFILKLKDIRKLMES